MFPIKINSHRKHKGLDLITFNDIDNINDVISYLHAEVFADAELDPGLLAEDEYHYQDLIGLEAISENGESIGTVRDLLEVPQGWILVLKKEDGKEALVPFVSEFVKKIDLEDRKIILTPIEGLL
jgi:16S rRNA processing protein RimM